VHAWLDDDTDMCTIIDEHLEAILLYIRWATFQELASQESADPDPESMALSILERCNQRRSTPTVPSAPTAPPSATTSACPPAPPSPPGPWTNGIGHTNGQTHRPQDRHRRLRSRNALQTPGLRKVRQGFHFYQSTFPRTRNDPPSRLHRHPVLQSRPLHRSYHALGAGAGLSATGWRAGSRRKTAGRPMRSTKALPTPPARSWRGSTRTTRTSRERFARRSRTCKSIQTWAWCTANPTSLMGRGR
jgi:hypothetical protein